MLVCDGGTIAANVTSINFTNTSTTTAYTIDTPTSVSNGTNMPGWPSTDPVVPMASGGNPGSVTVQLSVAAQASNTYEYTTDPTCPTSTNPRIVVSS